MGVRSVIYYYWGFLHNEFLNMVIPKDCKGVYVIKELNRYINMLLYADDLALSWNEVCTNVK